MQIQKHEVEVVISIARNWVAEQNEKHPAAILRSYTMDEITEEALQAPRGFRKELIDSLRSLSAQKLQELVAIMWLGRGEFDSYQDAMAHSRAMNGPGMKEGEKGVLVSYIGAKVGRLPQYLMAGMGKLGWL